MTTDNNEKIPITEEPAAESMTEISANLNDVEPLNGEPEHTVYNSNGANGDIPETNNFKDTKVQRENTEEKITLKKAKKKHGIFFKIFISLTVLIFLIVLPLAGFLLYSAIDGADPAEHIPAGHYAYINLPSAGGFIQKTLSMKTLDAVFASPETAQIQGLIRSLRASPELSAWWFKTVSNVRVDAAAYTVSEENSGGEPKDKNDFLIFAKLGFRSAATRLAPVILKIKPGLISSIKELETVTENNLKYWIYNANGQLIYIGTFKDCIIASTSKNLFIQSFSKYNDENTAQIKNFIRSSRKDSISILSNINYFTGSIKRDNSILSNAVTNLNFDKNTILNFNLHDTDLSASGNCNWQTENDGLKTILQRQSAVPGILNRLPKSASYITLINMGEPEFLFNNGTILFNSSILNSYKSASQASKFLFKKDINELLFSWMGEEIGMFGLEHSEEPIFFVSLKDENKCRAVFEDIFASIFVDKDTSAVVDGLRIPRIEFPDLVKALLRSFKIELPRPFYVISNGYLYLSQNAEAAASFVNDVKAGNLLVKTENWKTITKNISPETSIFMYYTVEDRIPNMLKGIDILKPILKDYGKGVFSIKLNKEQKLFFEFYTQKTETHSLGELAAFPYKSEEKITSNIYCGKNTSNVPFVYWAAGKTVYALNLADKTLQSLKLDDKAYLNVNIANNKITSVWAVSARGTVYKTDYLLKAESGFPILTGEKFGAEPKFINEGIVLPILNKPVLLFVTKDAQIFFSDTMGAKLKNSPYIFENTIAALPRSFDGEVYLFEADGKIKENYPVQLGAISAVQPILYHNEKKELWVAILMEDGKFLLKPCNGGVQVFDDEEIGYSINLNVSCRVQPVYSANLKTFFLIADAGHLYKINTQCKILDKIALKQKNADDYAITLMDLTGDKLDDVIVSGGGNAIYAYTSNLAEIYGFPVAGKGVPRLIDVDGDGTTELITCGIDNNIHSYRMQK